MKVRKAHKIRTERKESLQDVFYGTGGEIDPTVLSRFERGIRSMGVYKLKVLARYYHTTIDDLIELVDIPDTQNVTADSR